ncbi:MAG TPA: hypothetical protein VF808_04230 [Ktedonobacterales bacterium]
MSDTWIDDAERLSLQFFREVRESFAFLKSAYKYYGPASEKIEGPTDYRDTTAIAAYTHYRMRVKVGWYISSGNAYVRFETPQIRNGLPTAQEVEARRAAYPYFMDLYGLARLLGKAEDPDFLLGDVWNHYESKSRKRRELLENDLRGVLDGLARATERYASHVLAGDSSQFAAVYAYQDTHKDDYIRGRKK